MTFVFAYNCPCLYVVRSVYLLLDSRIYQDIPGKVTPKSYIAVSLSWLNVHNVFNCLALGSIATDLDSAVWLLIVHKVVDAVRRFGLNLI